MQDAAAVTQIDFLSDPGDYIGGGQTFSLTPSDGTIVAGRQGAAVVITFTAVPFPSPSPKTFWSLGLAPISSVAFVVGNYPFAQGWPVQSPKRPGLSIFGDGRGCNDLSGKFTVYEASFDAAGNVIAFAADAEQHCEGPLAPALRVRIRINSNVPMQLQQPQAMAGPPQEAYERTLITLDGSQSYDPDGHIVQWQWSQIAGPPAALETPNSPTTAFRAPEVSSGGADLLFRLDVADDSGNRASSTVNVHLFDRRDRRNLLAWRSPFGNHIGELQLLTAADGNFLLFNPYSGPAVAVGFDGGAFSFWSLDFAAPDAAPLTTGIYSGAQRFPFQPAGAPGLSVTGSDVGGCNTLTGQFTVLEVDSAVPPTRLGARFVQSCEGFMPPVRGTVLVNSIAPGTPAATIAGPQSTDPGVLIMLDGSASSSTGSALVSYKWRQLSGPSVVALSNSTAATVSFVTPPGPLGATLVFELEVADEDGIVDIATHSVIVGVIAGPPVEVPTSGPVGLALIALSLAVLGFLQRRNRRV